MPVRRDLDCSLSGKDASKKRNQYWRFRGPECKAGLNPRRQLQHRQHAHNDSPLTAVVIR